MREAAAQQKDHRTAIIGRYEKEHGARSELQQGGTRKTKEAISPKAQGLV
jgi:hypothetical protein